MSTPTFSPSTTAARPAPASRLSWRKKLLFILVIDLFLLGGAELIAGYLKPFYYTRVAAHEHLGRGKSTGEKRVFLFGESTIYGVPYGPENSTARWLEAILRDVLPDCQVRVINFGGPGQGSCHLADAVARTLKYQPDAVVVCVGHNEFLAAPLALATSGSVHRWMYFHCHLYRLGFHASSKLRGSQTPSEALAGIPPWSDQHAVVMAEYRRNLASIAATARTNQVPLVLCTPACPLDWAPAHSQTDRPLEPEQQDQFQAALMEVRRVVRSGEGSEDALLRLVAQAPNHAEVHYWYGRYLEGAGRGPEARQAYQRAIDLDCQPMRGQSVHAQVVREVAWEQGVASLIFAEVFASAAAGEPGSEWFIDHCHPRPRGQYLMARALAEKLAAQGSIAPSRDWQWDRIPSYDACLQRLKVTAEEWRAAERASVLKILRLRPEIAVGLTAVAPPLAARDDHEWQALHILALWHCGRLTEAADLFKALPTSWQQGDGAAAAWPADLLDQWLTAASELVPRTYQ